MLKKKILLILFFILIFVSSSCYAFSDELQINSDAAILVDSKNEKIIYEKNSNKKVYPASTTKILTAIIALENCPLNEVVTASSIAINSLPAGYSNASIVEGENLTIEQLVTVFLVHSANEVGFILAEHISGSTREFAKKMNEKATELGCTNSNFTNPSGIHEENHYSSANDLAKIAVYCMKNDTFRKIVSLKSCYIPATNKSDSRFYRNTNQLLQDGQYYYSYCIGIKTGFTSPAKNCLISASNKNGVELISVVLGGDSTSDGKDTRYLDSMNLFEYGYKNYSLKLITNSIYYNTSFGRIINNIIEAKNNIKYDNYYEYFNNYLLVNLFTKTSLIIPN